MKSIALVYNANREKNLEIVHELEAFLSTTGIKTVICKSGTKNSEWGKVDSSIDIAVVLGGDGTFLGSSRALAPKGIPIIGINTGHLGFLTEGKGKNTKDIIEKILSNQFKIEERTMLSTVLIDKSGNTSPEYIALNDAVISRGAHSKMLHMTLTIDGTPVADYVADGMIISTPTGSTAYALSAGGSVMDPLISGFEVLPICAHSLTSRPHIISDSREILIEFKRLHEGSTIQIDGQEIIDIKNDNKIKFTKSKHKVKLIRLQENESDFYSRIRQKFHLRH